MKHFAIVTVLVGALTFLMNLLLNSSNLLPVEASAQAEIIDRLFNTHFLLISFLFSLITVFIGYSLVVFRQRKGQMEEGRHIEGSTPLEVVWTIIPLGAVIFIAYLGSVSLAEVRKVDPQALEVKVTAGQWYWSFEYPDYGIVSKELVLPANRQVKLTLTSRDVIHSFWVPEFRVKQDVLPGENLVKELRITPTEIGDYKVRCAELCGGAHAYMESPVKVRSLKDYNQWVGDQLAAISDDPVARGRVLVEVNGCISCHSLDGSKGVGPTWKGLADSTVTLNDGTTAQADAFFLLSSIIKPDIQIVEGYSAGVMPKNYLDLLTEEQINDILIFIQSLK